MDTAEEDGRKKLKIAVREIAIGTLSLYLGSLSGVLGTHALLALMLLWDVAVVGFVLFGISWRWWYRLGAAAAAVALAFGLYWLARQEMTPRGPRLALEFTTAIPQKQVTFPGGVRQGDYGLSFAVRVTNEGDEPTQVRALWVEGDEAISPNEYLGVQESDGKTLDELGAAYQKAKPYRAISWSLSPEGADTTVAPRQERFFLFSAIEPQDPKMRVFEAGSMAPYFGDSTRRPARVTTAPTLLDFVTVSVLPDTAELRQQFRAPRLRQEVIDGRLRVTLETSDGRFPVAPSSMRLPYLTSPDELRNNPARDVFYGKNVYGSTDNVPRKADR